MDHNREVWLRVPNDIVQTFRNFVTAIVDQNNTMRSKRGAVLILLDETRSDRREDGSRLRDQVGHRAEILEWIKQNPQ
jgi:hypothetical protein